MPGWVNTHTHLAMNVYRGTADDVTLEEFLERLIGAELRALNEEVVTVGVRAAIAECLAGGTTTGPGHVLVSPGRACRGTAGRVPSTQRPHLRRTGRPRRQRFPAMLDLAETILEHNRTESPTKICGSCRIPPTPSTGSSLAVSPISQCGSAHDQHPCL
jgi:5-methylthioadenosine/S-adenosylhomocysteine deaminase